MFVHSAKGPARAANIGVDTCAEPRRGSVLRLLFNRAKGPARAANIGVDTCAEPRQGSVLRLLLAALGLAATLTAQIQLTTVEDIIYRADGQRFDGYAQIEWRSFLASDQSSITAYSKTVRVVNGVLKVKLTPTTTASAGAYYLVKYTINGRLQNTEYWAVGPSTVTLKLKDVRLAGPPAGGASVVTGTAGPVQLVDVVGLADELAARPRKGLAYSPSGAAVVNSIGELETASGQPSDCVRVDGTSGPCGSGGGGATFIDGETPAGLINGSNATFTLTNAPNPASSLQLYRNGVLQKSGSDFALVNNTVTFAAPSTPQLSDVLVAGYRLGSGGSVSGQAGGALTGFYPSPSIAPGAVANLHISNTAAISETKLALNFPTHTNTNDPSAAQKAALIGSAGVPSNANRYVTDQDPRLSDARTPASHALLSGSHFDTNPGSATRGDILVGQGATPTLWSRLPLGAANRCLISNGSDVVWNACLFTGFPAGSLPFVDSNGNLAHNNTRLLWDNSARRMGVGTGSPTSTLTVYDSAAGEGKTRINVRAGQDQQTTPLQSWQDSSGADLATLDSDGSLQTKSVKATTSVTQAAWQETGSPADPASTPDGAAWYNSAEKARRTAEGSQIHSGPQIVCSINGSSTDSTTQALLGRCRIPAALLRPGDRFEVLFDLSHEGTVAGFTYAVNWGSASLDSRTGTAAETRIAGRAEVVPQGTSIFWSRMSWGSAAALQAAASSATVTAGEVLVEVQGQMASATTETVTLRSLTVLRLPNQSNP